MGSVPVPFEERDVEITCGQRAFRTLWAAVRVGGSCASVVSSLVVSDCALRQSVTGFRDYSLVIWCHRAGKRRNLAGDDPAGAQHDCGHCGDERPGRRWTGYR